MIEFQHVTKSYLHHKGGRKYIFKDLTFSLPEGKNIAILGRNGAGKSTMINLLAGIDSPDRGKIVSDKRISWPIGLSGGFQGSLSARENCKFIARTQGFRGAELKRKVESVEQFSEIDEYFDLPMKTYSSGMRGRVAFGLSLAFDFDYYLVDEAMSVGDQHFKQKAKKVFEEKINHSNLILVTHGMSQVKSLCDIVMVLNEGRVDFFENVVEGIQLYQKL